MKECDSTIAALQMTTMEPLLASPTHPPSTAQLLPHPQALDKAGQKAEEAAHGLVILLRAAALVGEAVLASLQSLGLAPGLLAVAAAAAGSGRHHWCPCRNHWAEPPHLHTRTCPPDLHLCVVVACKQAHRVGLQANPTHRDRLRHRHLGAGTARPAA